MPHRIRKLRETLAELQERLEGAGEVGDETRSEIRGAMAELEAALRDSETDSGQPELPSSLRERFSEAIQNFKGSHPELTAAVGRVIDALADLGI
jgi:hypothetical protein